MTARSWTVLAFGVGMGGTGLLVHYPAFVALGVWAAGAVLTAAALTARPVRLATRVEGLPTRIPRGSVRRIVVHAHNTGRRTVRGLLLDVGAGPSRPLAPVPAGAERLVAFEVAWPERGEHRLGPVRAVRVDPLDLLRRESGTGTDASVLVVPVPVELRGGAASASRFTGAMSGRLFDGSVEFEGLREYVPGDDLRRMHWPSSQRTGKHLVRTFVDVALPTCTVVLDGDAEAFDGLAAAHDAEAPDVELAVDAAASVALAALGSRQLVRLWAGGPPVAADRTGPGEPNRVLDRLARWTPGPLGTLARAAAEIRTGSPSGDLVVLTGARDIGQLAVCHRLAPLFGRIVLVRAGTAGSAHERDGRVRILSVRSRAELAELWATLPDPAAGARS